MSDQITPVEPPVRSRTKVSSGQKNKPKTANIRKIDLAKSDGEAHPLSVEALFKQAIISIKEGEPIVKKKKDDVNTLLLGLAKGYSVHKVKIEKKEACASMLVDVEMGKKVEAVDFEGSQVAYVLGNAVTDDNKEVEMLDNKIIFVLSGNYCAYFCPHGYGDRDIVDFLNWLFKEKTKLLENGLVSALHVLPSTYKDKITAENISKISFVSKSADQVKGIRDAMIKVFKNVLNNESTAPTEKDTKADRLANAMGSVKVSTVIQCSDKASDAERNAMAHIGISMLEHAPVGTVVYLGKDLKITAHEVVMKGTISVSHKDGNVNIKDAMDSLCLWLTSTIQKYSLT